jgi:hypothetical protein
VDKLFLKVCETLVAYEILFRGEGNEIGTLALAAEEMGVVGRGELNKASKIVLAVKLEQRLKGWQSSEAEGCGLNEFDLGGLPFKDYLVFLVAGAESE